MVRGRTPRDRIVIGLGSGRCGTKSLAYILGLPHEAHALPWEHNESLFRGAIRKLRTSGGDVGCYWLTYVNRVLEIDPDTKFVCLKRPKDETVRSWTRRFVGAERFDLFVMHLDDEAQIHAPGMFPDYRDIPIPEAAGLYWEEYYERAEKIQHEHPESFRIFDMQTVLNDAEAQRAMMDFVGCPMGTWTEFHENRGGKKNPEFGNMIREVLGYLIRKDKIYAGTRATVTPKPGSRLGKIAVQHGISENETDPIVLDFSKLSEHLARPFDLDMIEPRPRQGELIHA